VRRTQEPAAPLDPAPGQLTVETDGARVRYRDGWHEVKLGLVAGWVDGQLQAPSYVAQRASPEQFGPRLLTEAARRGALEVVDWDGPPLDRSAAVLRAVLILADGAPWIWNLAGERIEIVDFYHAAEHLGTVAKALHPTMRRRRTAGPRSRSTRYATKRLAPCRTRCMPPRLPPRRGGDAAPGARLLPHQCRAHGLSGFPCAGAADRLGRHRVERQACGATAYEAPRGPPVRSRRPGGAQRSLPTPHRPDPRGLKCLQKMVGPS
jgi:hypothetical protein